MSKKLYSLTVTGTKFDTYEVEAATEEEAIAEARSMFRDDHESGSHVFDDIEVVVECDEDE
jgi:hypothetical protein